MSGGYVTDASKGRLEIEMGAARTLAEPLTIRGILRTFVNGAGPGAMLTLTGPVDCGSGEFRLNSSLRFMTTITGSNGVLFNGSLVEVPHLVTLSGTSANTLSGIMETRTNLLLDKPAGTNAVAGDLRIIAPAAVTWARSNQIANTSELSFEGGTADLNGNSETISELVFRFGRGTVRTGALGSLRVDTSISNFRGPTTSRIEGHLQLGAPNLRITLTPDPTDLMEIAAVTTPAVAGAGFVLTGGSGGTLRFTGVCSAPAVVNSGRLEVNSISPLMPVILNPGGTEGGAVFAGTTTVILAGTGTVGAITAGSGGGVVSPGGESPGTLRSGSLSLNSESAFRADIDGTTAGSGFDQLLVTGAVALNGAALTLDPRIETVGASFTLIENDGSDPISGTFAGLPQGSRLGGFTVSYTGGTGNDVTLLRISLGNGISRNWTGGGTDANWSTPANWSPSGLPQDGAVLVFPGGAARRTNVNNLSNLAVRRLLFTGGPYQISGNTIALAEGITVSGSDQLTHTLNVPLALLGAQIFSVGDQILNLGGSIDTNGMPLTFSAQDKAGTSAIICSGIISEGAADQFIKTGTGIVVLANANTTRGNLHIQAGTVRITNSTALGSRLGITTDDKGAELIVAGSNLAINETIQLAGTALKITDNAGAPGFGDPINCGLGLTFL